MRRIATLFIASLLAACAGEGAPDPLSDRLQHGVTVIDDRGIAVNSSCDIRARGYTDLPDNLSQGSFISVQRDEATGKEKPHNFVVHYRFGSMRAYCAGSQRDEATGTTKHGYIETEWYRLKITEDGFPLRVRLLSGQNAQVIIWELREGADGKRSYFPTWDHRGGLAASDETQATDDQIDKATLKVALPKGEYAITVTINQPPFWKRQGWMGSGGVRPEIDTIEYKLAVMRGVRPGQCGDAEVPDEFMIAETTQWDKFWSEYDKTYPEFNIQTMGDGRYLGKLKRDFFNWALAGISNFGEARIIGWKSMAGDTVAYTRKVGNGSSDLTHLDVLDCNEPPAVIGAHDEQKIMGSDITYYKLTDTRTGDQVDSWRTIGQMKTGNYNDPVSEVTWLYDETAEGMPPIVFQLFASKDSADGLVKQGELLLTMTQRKRTQADLWHVKKEPAMKKPDPNNSGKMIDRISPRIWGAIPANFTTSRNVKQRFCTTDSHSKYRSGGYDLNTCSDCCFNNNAGERRLEPRTETEQGPCDSWDDDGNCTHHITYYYPYNLCLCR